jgi:hypothetical protein
MSTNNLCNYRKSILLRHFQSKYCTTESAEITELLEGPITHVFPAFVSATSASSAACPDASGLKSPLKSGSTFYFAAS